MFSWYVRAKAIPDEKAGTIVRVLVEEWISVFGPMEQLLSGGGTNLVGKVVEDLSAMLGVDRMQTYRIHPQANGIIERWNRTLEWDLASFMATGDADWDEHLALACYRYNTGVCAATGMSPYKAVFGIEACEAWGEVDRACFNEEPESLANRLGLLHRQLLSKGKESRARAKSSMTNV